MDKFLQKRSNKIININKSHGKGENIIRKQSKKADIIFSRSIIEMNTHCLVQYKISEN